MALKQLSTVTPCVKPLQGLSRPSDLTQGARPVVATLGCDVWFLTDD